jgi:hypothetical protein
MSLVLFLPSLETMEEIAKSPRINANRHPQLCELSKNYYQAFEDLQSLKEHSDSVDTQTQTTWERLRWRDDYLGNIRSRIISYTGVLTLFNAKILSYI